MYVFLIDLEILLLTNQFHYVYFDIKSLQLFWKIVLFVYLFVDWCKIFKYNPVKACFLHKH